MCYQEKGNNICICTCSCIYVLKYTCRFPPIHMYMYVHVEEYTMYKSTQSVHYVRRALMHIVVKMHCCDRSVLRNSRDLASGGEAASDITHQRRDVYVRGGTVRTCTFCMHMRESSAHAYACQYARTCANISKHACYRLGIYKYIHVQCSCVVGSNPT